MSTRTGQPGEVSHFAGAGGERLEIYASRIKHAILALPCLYLGLIGIKVLAQGGEVNALNVGMVVFGFLSTAVLLHMGYQPKPIVVVDAKGIYCRRPAFGLIPWAAVAGMGLGRAAFQRTFWIIAIDEAAMSPDALERLKRNRGSSLMSPELARYQGKMAGYPTVQISVALLAISPKQLRALLAEKVHYAKAEAS